MSYLGLNLACRNDSNTKSIYTNRSILPMTVILCPGIYNSAIQETTWRWGTVSFVMWTQQSQTQCAIVWHSGDLSSCFCFFSISVGNISFFSVQLHLCTCYSVASCGYYKGNRHSSGFLKEYS